MSEGSSYTCPWPPSWDHLSGHEHQPPRVGWAEISARGRFESFLLALS